MKETGSEYTLQNMKKILPTEKHGCYVLIYLINQRLDLPKHREKPETQK